jgi:hypothetical protein
VRSLPPDCKQLLVRPWSDPIIDQIGYDARSPYVERFWLGVLGPSATWFVRYVADRFDTAPHGFDVDVAECASAIGLGRPWGVTAAFPRMINRVCQFGTGRLIGRNTLEVRRMLPPLTPRQIERLPEGLRVEHSRWTDQAPAAAQAAALRDRARRLALSLLELGEEPDAAERQLQRWRFPGPIAREATMWAVDRHGGESLSGTPEISDAPSPTRLHPARRPAPTPAPLLPTPVGTSPGGGRDGDAGGSGGRVQRG